MQKLYVAAPMSRTEQEYEDLWMKKVSESFSAEFGATLKIDKCVGETTYLKLHVVDEMHVQLDRLADFASRNSMLVFLSQTHGRDMSVYFSRARVHMNYCKKIVASLFFLTLAVSALYMYNPMMCTNIQTQLQSSLAYAKTSYTEFKTMPVQNPAAAPPPSPPDQSATNNSDQEPDETFIVLTPQPDPHTYEEDSEL